MSPSSFGDSGLKEGRKGVPRGGLDKLTHIILSQRCSCLHFGMFEVIKRNGEIKMNIKAYNGRCVAEWLAHSLRSAASQPEMYKEERLPLAALAMWLGA